MEKGILVAPPANLLLAILESAVDHAIEMEEKKLNKTEAKASSPKEAAAPQKAERVLNIFELSQVLTEGKMARSTQGNLLVTKNGKGLVNAKTLEFLPFTTEVINMTFSLEPERVMVPAPIAIEAYKQGNTIEIDYKDTLIGRFTPGDKHEPKVSMDVMAYGVFYVVK